MTINCKRCMRAVTPTLTRRPYNCGLHLEARCPECKSWLSWVRQTPEILQQLERQEQSRQTPASAFQTAAVQTSDSPSLFDWQDRAELLHAGSPQPAAE